jgi:putative transposase
VNKSGYDTEGHAHFVTFSCYRRRKLLVTHQARNIVTGILSEELEKRNGKCLGFAIMPDHVHAMVWFPAPESLSGFLQFWKGRSSHEMKRFLSESLAEYGETFLSDDPVWQTRFYDRNIFTEEEAREKLAYMHNNPVKAGLAKEPADWVHSSARWYEKEQSAGVPIEPWGNLL